MCCFPCCICSDQPPNCTVPPYLSSYPAVAQIPSHEAHPLQHQLPQPLLPRLDSAPSCAPTHQPLLPLLPRPLVAVAAAPAHPSRYLQAALFSGVGVSYPSLRRSHGLAAALLRSCRLLLRLLLLLLLAAGRRPCHGQVGCQVSLRNNTVCM